MLTTSSLQLRQALRNTLLRATKPRSRLRAFVFNLKMKRARGIGLDPKNGSPSIPCAPAESHSALRIATLRATVRIALSSLPSPRARQRGPQVAHPRARPS